MNPGAVIAIRVVHLRGIMTDGSRSIPSPYIPARIRWLAHAFSFD